MLIVTTDYISGKELEMLGIVKGATIQTKHLGKDILSVFLPLADTLGEQILDLTVYRAEIVLRPGGDGGVQLGTQPQRDLLLVVGHKLTRDI